MVSHDQPEAGYFGVAPVRLTRRTERMKTPSATLSINVALTEDAKSGGKVRPRSRFRI
jgi:hypothetical protein